MKIVRLILIALILQSPIALAAKPLFVGVSLGSSGNGFAWNGHGGYQFNPYVAVETGYTEIDGVRVFINNVKVHSHFTGIDMLLKLMMPFAQHYDAFFKIGAMNAVNEITRYDLSETKRNSIVPEFGIGVSDSIAKHSALTLEGVTTQASSNNDIPASYAVYVGMDYRF